MRSVWEILYARQMALHYVAPPVCEVIFSGSSNPVIILSYPQIGQVTGFVIGGFGGFGLSWNAFPGAICYNIYYVGGDNVAVLLAQCVTEPNFVLPDNLGPGEIIVTPITLDGEGEPSDPIPYPVGGGGGTSTVTVLAECKLTSRLGFPGFFRIARATGDITGNLVVNFTLTGTAVNGIDYDAVPLSATIPNGSDFVLVPIIVIEAALLTEKFAILTLLESTTYAIGSSGDDTVGLRPPIYRIVDYGGAEPLFIPPPEIADSDECEWDGTWNFQNGPFPTGESSYEWKDFNGTKTFPNASVNGKVLWETFLSGPYSGRPEGPFWQLGIFCRNEADEIKYVWAGSRFGPTGAGTYDGFTLVNSDPRLTITVESFP